MVAKPPAATMPSANSVDCALDARAGVLEETHPRCGRSDRACPPSGLRSAACIHAGPMIGRLPTSPDRPRRSRRRDPDSAARPGKEPNPPIECPIMYTRSGSTGKRRFISSTHSQDVLLAHADVERGRAAEAVHVDHRQVRLDQLRSAHALVSQPRAGKHLVEIGAVQLNHQRIFAVARIARSAGARRRAAPSRPASSDSTARSWCRASAASSWLLRYSSCSWS